MKILIDRISKKHQDSFWYEGLIAEKNGYELYATGEIKGVFEGETMYGTSLVGHLSSLGYKDKDLEKVDFVDNNWFEIFYPDNESYVPDNQDYDSVLKELESISLERNSNER